jgi:hypothetical protein
VKPGYRFNAVRQGLSSGSSNKLPPLPHELAPKTIYKPESDEDNNKENVAEVSQRPTSGPSKKLPPLPHELLPKIIYKPQSDGEVTKENVYQASLQNGKIIKSVETQDKSSPTSEVITIESSDEENDCIEISSESSDSERTKVPDSDSDDDKVKFYIADYKPLPKLKEAKKNKIDWEERYMELQRVLHPQVKQPMFVLPKINLVERRSPVEVFTTTPSPPSSSTSPDEDLSISLIENFATVPNKIPQTKFQELPYEAPYRMLKPVQILEVVSPSRFTFRFNLPEYEQMSEFMKYAFDILILIY